MYKSPHNHPIESESSWHLHAMSVICIINIIIHNPTKVQTFVYSEWRHLPATGSLTSNIPRATMHNKIIICLSMYDLHVLNASEAVFSVRVS